MLIALRIESFAIIDSLEIRFGPGLNVLTGETGAGKSILVDAFSLLLGGRADPGMIRSGAKEAVVEGIFYGEAYAEKARGLGLPVEGNEVLVRRTIAKGGRGRVHVNGGLATVAILWELLDGMVDLSGQHEHLSLLRKESHGELLDRFAGLGDEMAAYSEAHGRWVSLEAERGRLEKEQEERERRRDYLTFLLDEMEEVDPQPGEDEALLVERKILSEAGRLREAVSFCEAALESEEGSASDRLAASAKRLAEAASWDPALLPFARQIELALVEVQEAARSLSQYGERLSFEPERLSVADDRLEALRRIARKHGGSLEAALAHREEISGELASLSASRGRSEEIAREIALAAREACGLAGKLSAARQSAAGRLCLEVLPSLERLGLETAKLEIRFSEPGGALEFEGKRLGPRGAEEVEFFLCTNVGEESKPLARVASGGELSRVLLALKAVLASVDPVGCYVFDEVDAGIGGATAISVGKMLQEAARERQVLCITHLPQVAAFADSHLHVSKRVEEGRTFSMVEELAGDVERKRGIARMLAGTEDPPALAAADDLLQKSRRSSPKARRVHRRSRAREAEVQILP